MSDIGVQAVAFCLVLIKKGKVAKKDQLHNCLDSAQILASIEITPLSSDHSS